MAKGWMDKILDAFFDDESIPSIDMKRDEYSIKSHYLDILKKNSVSLVFPELAREEFHEIIAKRIEMDEQVSRELDEKGIKPELDGEEDYYKANKEWFNREIEKLRKEYGVELKR